MDPYSDGRISNQLKRGQAPNFRVRLHGGKVKLYRCQSMAPLEPMEIDWQ